MSEELEQFERHLSRQPVRRVPAEWRAEILAAARDAQAAQARSRVTHYSLLSILKSRVSAVLWPHPAAWAGLAAAWILIAAVNFSDRDRSPGIAEDFTPPSPTMLAELKQERRMLAELMGTREPSDADRAKPATARPRTEWVEILTG